MSDENYVRYSVRMEEKLREDAKRSAERGELAEGVRNYFRRRAYGGGATQEESELQRKKAELREVRNRIDDLRHERKQIDAEIESQEARATRLEEQITELEQDTNELETKLSMLEQLVQDGERMWPTRIKNVAEVDKTTAQELYHQLQNRNNELPDAAFNEPSVHEPRDWRDV